MHSLTNNAVFTIVLFVHRLTMMVSAIAIQLNIFVELLCRFVAGHGAGGRSDVGDDDNSDTVWPLPLRLATMIDGEFAAATLLISYGAVLGRASPVQLVVMTLCQSVAYAFNKVVLVFGLVAAEDVGGSMTIHMFGAFFGLSVSSVLGSPKTSTTGNASPSGVSDVMSLIGTTLLWVYWPSFVGATETGTPVYEARCVMNTILALLGSTLASFYLSQKLCHGKLDVVHIANATLAGGVAVGSSARLLVSPGGALLLGTAAGVTSVCGYVYSTPRLEQRYRVYDTCGVCNLHGWPSVLGGFASAVLAATMDSSTAADGIPLLALSSTGGPLHAAGRQIMGVLCTLGVAVASGYGTGLIMVRTATGSPDEYDDAVWYVRNNAKCALFF